MSFTFIKAKKNDEDCKLIMNWRNDETTRKMSINNNLKIWDDFKDEYYNNYHDNYIHPYFACLNGVKICFIGCISRDNNEINEISINMSPKYRGNSYSKPIIKQFIKFVVVEYIEIKKFIATVKYINIPSNKLFISCGFKHLKNKIINDEKYLIYEFKVKMI
jgi:RimJ/RimL family protein N-acetyltransferase